MLLVTDIVADNVRKGHDLRTHKQQADSDWLNPLSLGSMSASGYIANSA